MSLFDLNVKNYPMCLELWQVHSFVSLCFVQALCSDLLDQVLCSLNMVVTLFHCGLFLKSVSLFAL